MHTKRFIKLLIAITFVAIVSFAFREAIANNEQGQADQRMQRSREADAARWKAMGEYYTAKQAQEALDMQRSREADAARWEAMGEYYSARQTQEAQDLQRSWEADAARWEAMAEYYSARQGTNK